MNMLRRFFIRVCTLFGFGTQTGTPPIDFPKLESVLHYSIRDKRIFSEALSHRSYLQVTGNDQSVSNERLEFLGDAVLNLIAAEYLFRRDITAEEGDLTKLRSRLVNRKALGIFAKEHRLMDFMLLSPNTLQIPGRGMETILADAFEAIIGAIYLDGGFLRAKKFVEMCFNESLEKGSVKLEDENFKSRLLELSQARGFGFPRYVIVREEGPDHDRTFTVEVILGTTTYGSGYGKNKKDAEQVAAEKTLQLLDNNESSVQRDDGKS